MHDSGALRREREVVCRLDVIAETQTPSFRDGPKDQTSDAQLRIGESRDSGFDAEPVIGPRFARTRWHRPGMTASGFTRCLKIESGTCAGGSALSPLLRGRV